MERIFDRSTLEELRAGLRGAAYVPGEDGYDEARKAWNLNAHQHPALVVMAAGAADVIAAVRLARDAGLGVGVMATGHGVVSLRRRRPDQHLAHEGRAGRSRSPNR